MLMGVNKKGKHDGTPRFLLGPLRFASSEDVLGEGSPSLFDFFVESTFFPPRSLISGVINLNLQEQF